MFFTVPFGCPGNGVLRPACHGGVSPESRIGGGTAPWPGSIRQSFPEPTENGGVQDSNCDLMLVRQAQKRQPASDRRAIVTGGGQGVHVDANTGTDWAEACANVSNVNRSSGAKASASLSFSDYFERGRTPVKPEVTEFLRSWRKSSCGVPPSRSPPHVSYRFPASVENPCSHPDRL